MYTQNTMKKNWYVTVGAAAALAATVGMGTAMAGTLDTTWKEATLPQVKAMLEKDTGKVSGDTVTYSGKTVHVVAAAVLPGFPFPSFEVHDKKNPTLEIPAGATVDVTFINTNKGFGHSFDITKKRTSLCGYAGDRPHCCRNRIQSGPKRWQVRIYGFYLASDGGHLLLRMSDTGACRHRYVR